MNAKHHGQGRTMWRRLTAVAATVLFAAALPAQAENVLQDVSFSASGDGGVNVTLQLAGPASDAQAFTTDSPPRIAVDLPDTRSEVANRRIAVGSGSTSAISTIEAGGKTRVVVDLFHMATYDARTEGNRVLLSIGGAQSGSTTAMTGDQSDPAKRIGDGIAVSNIDFRRTPSGAGRVIISFDGEGAVADMQTEGGTIYVDLAHVGLPENLSQRLDVTDFATPVQTIESRRSRGGTGIRINTAGNMESLAYQTGNEYVVEVSPIAEAEAEAASNQGGTLGGSEVKTYDGAPVTFNFQDIPVRTVLQLIAEQSGKNIVAADTVEGNITLRLMNVPWDQTLDIILRAKQLDKREDGNVIWVAPQSEIAGFEKALADARIELEQREALQTVYIPINYGSAEEIANLLTSEAQQAQSGGGGGGGGAGGGALQQRGFLSPRGSVTFDSRSNTLLLNDISSKIAEVRDLIEILDRPVDQVLIEARIVIATEDFSREMGARFGAAGIEHNSGNSVFTHGSSNSVINARNGLVELLRDPEADGPTFLYPDGYNVNLPAVNPLATKFALGILGANYLLDLELSALETEGRGEVVANPRVITSNQQEAVIKQGDEVGYVTQQNSGGAGGQFTVQFKEVVLELKVTPTITQDDRVFLKMNVKKDQVEGYVQTALYSVPQISKREINTSVLVDNGQTVVLGGVYEFNNSEDISKVPFLGDIPGIGKLFQNKLGEKSKAELLIFVTPKILRPAPKR
ncbi:MAG: type IV pilus secretin PilQ [Lysobacteraceae bacterium]